MHALIFDKDGSKDKCDKTQFQKSVDCDLIENLLGKFEFIIDLQKFDSMCYEINCILSKYGYFLRIFESKKKYRRLAEKIKASKKLLGNYLVVLLKNIAVLHRFQSNMKKAKKAF